MNELELSKILSYVLRHVPEKYNLTLDEGGWGDIDTLIKNIKRKHPQFKNIGFSAILQIVNNNRKKRLEISEDNTKIRALYGHTFENTISKNIVVPPEILYHGTSNYTYSKFIKRNGLKKMKRQYVHLTQNINDAERVAKRKSDKIIVLRILALESYKNGYKFYQEESIWLSDDLPTEYIQPI
ncbi:MAG: RNA 2'-phosphotransferase [Weeksellaceae bacterium]